MRIQRLSVSALKNIFYRFDERLQLILIGALVGLCGGLLSFVLNRSLAGVSEFLRPFRSCWYGPLIPAAGAALAMTALVYLFRESGGHGVPEVIFSITKCGGFLKLRSSFSRIVSCLLTIASGGSAGPEAPIVISGASIGSNVGTFFNLKERQRTVLVGCGAAAAIAAIFNAPIAGMVFTLEVIIGEWSSVNIIPIAIASVVGTKASHLLQGNQIPFESAAWQVNLCDIAAAPALGIITAVAAIVLIRLLRLTMVTSKKYVSAHILRAASGGFCVGLLGIFLPDVLGEGYGTIRTIISHEYTASFFIITMVFFAKTVATALTVGTGGSGGVFAPCLVIGSFAGLLYYKILIAVFPSIQWIHASYFALLGMAGLISSVLQAPLTGIFLIIEITGSYELLIPVVLVSVLSVTLSHVFEPSSIYHHELVEKGELLRPRTDGRVLAELKVEELLERDCRIVRPAMFLGDIVDIFKTSHRNYFPVVDSDSGEFLGLVYLDEIRPLLFDQKLYQTVLVEDLMETHVSTISPDYDLMQVLELFEKTHSWSLPVVKDGQYLGLVSKATILDFYRKELLVQEET